LAVQKSSLQTVKILLSNSAIKVDALNLRFFNTKNTTVYQFFSFFVSRGQTPLHLLAMYGKENAAPIFSLILDFVPDYRLDDCDADGNTGLQSLDETVVSYSIPMYMYSLPSGLYERKFQPVQSVVDGRSLFGYSKPKRRLDLQPPHTDQTVVV